MDTPNSQIEYVAVSQLKPWAKNARTHSKKQIRQVADSIETFGFTNPVLIDAEYHILAGHARVEAAKSIGIERVPCVCLDHMTPEQKRAYVLADNKLALNAGWDEVILAEELEALLEFNLDFDVTITGFEMPEIDSLLLDQNTEITKDNPLDKLPKKAPRRSNLGDLWQLGKHRLICGSALERATFERLMGGERAAMVFTDPPYNVPIDGHVGNSGQIKHREFVMASGEMSVREFTEFLKSAFNNMVSFSVEGSIHYVCMDWRHMAEMLEAGQEAYTELKNLIVWVKDNGGMGSFYRSRHELVFVFKTGTARHQNNFGLGEHGRYRTNVWEYRGINSLHAQRGEELAMHPTVKPVEMIADAILDVSSRGEIIIDPFGGSGSTLMAAEQTGRRAYLVELDPLYCDTILARWEAATKRQAEQVLCGWSRVEGA
ncbi:site-specific DNA-methyltransferase [Marivivens donghaensis]|uniref:site-specific DNA-methyltransferase n=1 Tax=Marivivens donghaensis TaxID=1699413 RepID=UPI00201F134E|nr:DNA methyltransferase [Marivivens donghaensis]MCL7407653.1 site-specific DNA-methyltransferase [Marivivens donghaensis]MDN3704368.1 DNA methyltransferase [Marivivens donghaensis]